MTARSIGQFQRRAADVALVIREAVLRGMSTRQARRVLAVMTGEVVSTQTVSKTQSLCSNFIERLKDE
ncbi:MAG: hypothetical protein DMG05_11770 [Acidobacteria bacterium]|nr:MAG: hypothetical protein DMG05_11770 [Acidobacteriota bacterium]